jgi:hypothetical protein
VDLWEVGRSYWVLVQLNFMRTISHFLPSHAAQLSVPTANIPRLGPTHTAINWVIKLSQNPFEPPSVQLLSPQRKVNFHNALPLPLDHPYFLPYFPPSNLHINALIHWSDHLENYCTSHAVICSLVDHDPAWPFSDILGCPNLSFYVHVPAN